MDGYYTIEKNDSLTNNQDNTNERYKRYPYALMKLSNIFNYINLITEQEMKQQKFFCMVGMSMN